MSDTNTPEQSPLNDGTNGQHDKPHAPNLNVDPDIATEAPDADAPDQDADHTRQQDHDPMSEDDTASGGAPESPDHA